MKNFYENYKSFPHTDCGYCGNPSCVTMLRKYCIGKSKLEECIYFSAGAYDVENIYCSLPQLRSSPGQAISYVRPCPTEPSKVTIEVNLLPSVSSPYGYFDMITAEKIFNRTVPGLKISPSLGIARIESENGDIMVFSEGKIVIRRGKNEERAFWQISRVVRLLWATVNWRFQAESVQGASLPLWNASQIANGLHVMDT
ncbi:MAG: hypothetical protein ACUVQ5_04805 [Candidatus Methanomethylicaceae archaeon]